MTTIVKTSATLGTISIAISFVVWKYVNLRSNSEKIAEYLDTYHEVLVASFETSMVETMEESSYENMMSKVSASMEGFEEVLNNLPELIQESTENLVRNMGSMMDSYVIPTIQSLQLEREETLLTIVPGIIENVFKSMDDTFQGLVSDVGNESASEAFVAFYDEMVSTMKPKFSAELIGLFETNFDSRIERVTEFYNVVKTGNLFVYGEFIRLGKVIFAEFVISNPDESYVHSLVEDRLSQLVINNMRYVNIREFGDQLIDESDVRSILEPFFIDPTDVRNHVETEISFRIEKNHFPSILQTRMSSLYLSAYDRNTSNNVISSAQQKALNDLLEEKYNIALEKLKDDKNDTVYTLSSLTVYSESHLISMLPKVYTYMMALFIEFKNVMLRARFEGSQTTILRFFEMRQALNYEFFFAMCSENDFDLDATEQAYESMYITEMESARSKMVGFARLSHIMYMYDDAFDFLNASAEILFDKSENLWNIIGEMTSTFHDSLAHDIADLIDVGVGEAYEEEEPASKVSIDETFSIFRASMEVNKVQHLIQTLSALASSEIAGKVKFVTDLIPDLIKEFKSEVVNKFTNEYFEGVQELFITDEDIDYNGMKRFVVDEMNADAGITLATYNQLISEYIDSQISGLNATLAIITAGIRESIDVAPVSEDERLSAHDFLDSLSDDTAGLVSSVETSLTVNIDAVLRQAIVELDVLTDILTQNFFNTSLQVIVNDFKTEITSTFSELFFKHQSLMFQKHKELANNGKEIFEAHVREVVKLDTDFRDTISFEISEAMGIYGEEIASDYDINSYLARQSILRNNMKAKSEAASFTSRMDRYKKVGAIMAEYNVQIARFQNLYEQEGIDLLSSYQIEFSSTISEMYKRSSDIASIVSAELINMEGKMRRAHQTMFRQYISQVISTPLNDLPPLNIFSIIYPSGVVSSSDRYQGDLHNIMTPSVMIPELEDSTGVVFDEDEIVEVVSSSLNSLHSTLGASTIQVSADDVYLSMSDYAGWEEQYVDNAILELEITMEQSLKDNTCINKPTCLTKSTVDGEEVCNYSCREGYVLGNNSWGVLCCHFDPAASGIPWADILVLVGIELLLAFLISPENIGLLGKMVGNMVVKISSFALRAGSAAGRVVSRFVGLTSRVTSKFTGPLTKVLSKVALKIASKTGIRAGVAIAKKFIGKLVAKLLAAAGKLAGKAAAKLAISSAGKTAAKSLLSKVISFAASGPLAIALIAFELLSLLLDLFDPAGYNTAQQAGQIDEMRASIQERYDEALLADGIVHPLTPDPLYNMNPDKLGEFKSNLITEWITEQYMAYMSANEERWAHMSYSDAAREQHQKLNDLSDQTDELNFDATLTCANIENTYLLRVSTINGTDSSVVGTEEDKDYDSTTKTHLMKCMLNESGVVAFNSFEKLKTDFMNGMVNTPLYRWTRISDEGGYIIFSELTSSELSDAAAVVAQRKQDAEDESIDDNELNSPTISKSGWSLVNVDADEEFWKQYTYSQESGTSLPKRADFHLAWDNEESKNRTQYEHSIITTMDNLIAELAPDGEDAASVQMVRDQKEDSPEWYPTYDDLYAMAKEEMDANIEAKLEEELEFKISGDAILESIVKDMDEQAAEAQDITVQQATKNRIKASTDPELNQVTQRFAVWKGGFAQSSPLFEIKKTCDEMGYETTFDQERGLCDIHPNYCGRYGLTAFYSKDLGVNDCRLAGSQRGFESVFGTTITRSVKRTFTSQGSPGPSGPLGSSRELTNHSSEIEFLPLMGQLDHLGLGSKYDLWS